MKRTGRILDGRCTWSFQGPCTSHRIFTFILLSMSICRIIYPILISPQHVLHHLVKYIASKPIGSPKESCHLLNTAFLAVSSFFLHLNVMSFHFI
jgi:hypothetical protein